MSEDNTLLIDSGGYVLKLIEKILSTNIEIKGTENLPLDKPKIFVANHFTRIEALIVPYALYNLTKRKVGVIADDSIFKYFGNILKDFGALPKSTPNRNNIILSDILQGTKDWMIFPEGQMVKGKKIIKEENHYCVTVNGKTEKVFTGAAFFALSSQLLREDYIANRITDKKSFNTQYLMTDNETVTKDETVLIPINISYSPLRTGKNFLTDISEKIFSDMSEHFKEEIEIESNIVLHSKIIIHILKPISTKEITQNFHLQDLNKKHHSDIDHEIIINAFRYKLTHDFMKTIYENLTIRFDHLFVAILHFYPNDFINKQHFKRLLYLIAHKIKNSTLQYDEEIEKNFIHLISFEEYAPFEDVLKIATKDAIIAETDKNYVISKENLLEGYTHDTIRLKNILKVFLNEVLIIEDVVKMVEQYCQLPKKDIDAMLLIHLINQEKDEYLQDYLHWAKDEDIKPKEVGEPYFIQTEKSNIGIIALHGFCSAPMEVHEMATYLNKKGFNVYAPRLRGHGTTPEDLKERHWNQWYESLSRAIIIATLMYDEVYIVGFSTGGLLALLSQKKQTKKLKGIICINAALKLNDIRIKAVVPAINFWNDLVSAFNANAYQKEFIPNNAEYPLINYSKHYIKSINELHALMQETSKILKTITLPVAVFQASNDPVVNPKSANEIFEEISSKNKKLQFFDFHNHVMIRGSNSKVVFDEIIEFVKSVSLK
ncbi:MAG: alpha/beta fold hydrolase [Candidatus Marinarcus sp.]|uniref:alpha/beta fold hydrolase n=1 Tax=Candidatus Marinarcus sp. TaxID=3100987 RepID=UPI003AFF79A1